MKAALAVAALLSGAAAPALATAVYEYKPGEYVIVDQGQAPSNKLSIAAHGEGDMGEDNFHLYLMAEPAHRVIAPLDSIDSNAIFDSGPTAFHARWSPDSGHVAIIFRTDRHDLTMQLYEIGLDRARSRGGPTLLQAVNKKLNAAKDENYRLVANETELSWLSATQFMLTKHTLFQAKSPELARALGAFAKQTADGHPQLDDNGKPIWPYFVEFSGQATGEFAPDGDYRLKELKPGTFKGAN